MSALYDSSRECIRCLVEDITPASPRRPALVPPVPASQQDRASGISNYNNNSGPVIGSNTNFGHFGGVTHNTQVHHHYYRNSAAASQQQESMAAPVLDSGSNVDPDTAVEQMTDEEFMAYLAVLAESPPPTKKSPPAAVSETAKEGDAKDEDTKEGDAKDGDTMEGDAKDGDTKEGDAKDGDTKEGDAKDEDTKEGDAKDEDTKEGDAKDGDTKEGDAKEDKSQEKENKDEKVARKCPIGWASLPWNAVVSYEIPAICLSSVKMRPFDDCFDALEGQVFCCTTYSFEPADSKEITECMKLCWKIEEEQLIPYDNKEILDDLKKQLSEKLNKLFARSKQLDGGEGEEKEDDDLNQYDIYDQRLPPGTPAFASVREFKKAFKPRTFVLAYASTVLEKNPCISRMEFVNMMQSKFPGGNYTDAFNALIVDLKWPGRK